MPTEAGSALGPHQTVGPLLDLARDQRGAPEQADEQRQDQEQDGDQDQAEYCELNWSDPVWQASLYRRRRADRRRSPEAEVGERGLHREAGRDYQTGEGGQPGEGEQRLLAVLPPRQPDHAGTPQARGVRVGAVGEVGQDDVLQGDLVRRPGGIGIRPLARTSKVDCRSVWLARITRRPRRRLAVVARADQLPVLGDQVFDRADELDLGGVQHDQVVADPFEVGQQVRGEQHRGARVGDAAHQRLEELAPGQGVEARHRLVEQQQPRPFGQRRARATWARCPPESLPTGLSGGTPSWASRFGPVPRPSACSAWPPWSSVLWR